MMKKKKGARCTRALSVLLVAGGCMLVCSAGTCQGGLPRSYGPVREVTVVSPELELITPVLEQFLGRKIATPQPEPEFRLRLGTVDRFEGLAKMRLLLLVGTSGDTLVRTVLGSKIDSLPGGEFGLFKFPNGWARNQWVLVCVAQKKELLVPGLIGYGPRIRQEVYAIVLDQLARAVYLRGIDRRLTDSLTNRFGWAVDVPQGWRLGAEHAGEQFVYIFGHYPDRTVFVHWQDTTRALVAESIVNLRDRLTGRFFEGDSVERSLVMADSIEFLSGPALRLRGVWQNRQEVMGGPFVAYAFNCQGRFFLVDGLVFNPGKKKLDNLFEVEALVRTFRPGAGRTAVSW